MFARHYRLPGKEPLHATTTYATPYFSLRIAKNNLVYNRYGFVTSKKVDTKAVMRNRVKRQLRAYVEQLHPTLQSGNDLLFILKPACKEVVLTLLQQAVTQVVQNAQLLVV